MTTIPSRLQMAEKMNVNINATKLYLGDFPDEVLLIVMSHLTDMSLLQMAQVSKRFRRIAKESFAKRYSGESRNQFYPLLVLCENEIENQRQNRPFFCTFGENIHAIEIDIDYGDNAVGKDILVEDDHWLYDSIPIYCTALTKLHIRNARGIYLTRFLRHLPTLTHLFLDTSTYLNHLWTQHSYPKLISFELVSSGHHDERNEKCNLDEFFNKNRQLKRICMRYCMCDENILDLLSSGMNELESVELFSCYEIANQKSTTINISKLKSIVLVGVYSTFHVLNAISKGCKNIACLKMENMNWGDEWDDDAIQTLCSLEKLTSLQICSNNITVENLQKIIDRVPNLTSLCLTGVDRSSEVLENLPFVVSICDKLVKLEFKSNTWSRKDVGTDFMQNIVDSIHRNNSEVTLQLGPGSRKLFFSQDQIRDGNALIYWAGCEANSSQSTSNLLDLGDECLQKIVGYLDIRSQSALYNTCTRTRKIVKDYIASHVYRIYDESILNSDESIFQSLGEHISRLVLVLTYCDTQRCMQFLSLANRYCSRITELTLLDSWFLPDQQFKCILPNLTKLVISEGRRINYQTLRSLECPMLTHLEIDKFEADVGFQTVESLNHDGFYRHLTTLKVYSNTLR